MNVHHEDDYDNYSTYPVDTLSNSRRLTSSEVTFNLYYSKLNYIETKNSIHFYYGFGALFGIAHRYYVNTRNGSDYQNQNTWSIGPMGVLGVEWFPRADISFSGEYAFLGTISYTRGIFTENIFGFGMAAVTRNGFSYDLNQQLVKLVVSVYFSK